LNVAERYLVSVEIYCVSTGGDWLKCLTARHKRNRGAVTKMQMREARAQSWASDHPLVLWHLDVSHAERRLTVTRVLEIWRERAIPT
jgi:hypothetical protein